MQKFTEENHLRKEVIKMQIVHKDRTTANRAYNQLKIKEVMKMDMDINLTMQERLSLYNQYTILQKLSLIQGDEHEAEFYGLRAKIVSEGYLYDYYMLTECIADDFLLEDAKLVWDTLDMYSAIYYSYSRIENPKLTTEQIHFDGFDGNHETRSMVYCRFIINELERYTEFKENGYNDYNSHCQRCDKYKAMIAKWNDMGKSHELNEEQIEELIETY